MANPFALLQDEDDEDPFALVDPFALADESDSFALADPEPESWWEGALRGGASASLATAQAVSRIAKGFTQAIHPKWWEETPVFRRQMEEIDRQNQMLGAMAAEIAPEDQRPWRERFKERKLATLARTAAEAAPSLGAGLAATAVAGPAAGVAVGGTLGFSTSATSAYDESRAAGNDEKTSLAIAGTVGTLSALLEAWGLKGIAKPLKTAFGRSVTARVARGETDKLIREVLVGAGKEAGTEVGQELVAAAGELMSAVSAGRPAQEALDEIAETLDDRIAQAAAGGLMLGGGTGTLSIAQQGRRNRKSARAAAQELLNQAAQMDPAAWSELARPATPGEWQTGSLPTTDWTTESAQEAHDALEKVIVPDVLKKPKGGKREVRGGIHRSSQLLGAEVPFIEIVRKGFGDKMGDEFQDLASYARKTTTLNRTIVDAAIINHAGEEIAPAYKKFVNLASRIGEHPVEDPTGGRWLLQYTGERDRHGDLRLDRGGNRVMPAHLKKSAGNRYLEEARWGLQMEELGNRKEFLAGRVAELEAQKAQVEAEYRETQKPTKKMQVEMDRVQGRLRTLRDREIAIKAKVQVGAKQKQPLENLEAATARIAKEISELDENAVALKGMADRAGDVKLQRLDQIKTELEDTKEQLSQIQFSDKTMTDVRDRMSWLRQHPQWQQLEALAEGASAWDNHAITMMADAEIISREQERAILARGKHYAGFFLSTPNAQPASVREFMAKGAEEPGRLKVGLRRDAPQMLPSEASLYRMMLTQKEATDQVKKNALLTMVEAEPEFWAQAGVALEPIEGVHRSDLYVRAKREGETVPVYMPRDLLTAFEKLTPVQGNLYQRAAMSFARVFSTQRRVAALLTPTFAVGQTFRDQADAALWAAEVGYRPWVEMGRGMLHMITGSPEAKHFRAGGGGMGSIASLDVEQSQDLLSQVALHANEEGIQSSMKLAVAAMRRFGKTWTKETFGSGGEHALSGAFYPMARLLETLDTSTRFGAYIRALDKGRTHAEAMAISRRSAVDFARGGEAAHWMSQILPFSNARAQAFSLTRDAVKRAGRKEQSARSESQARAVAHLESLRSELAHVEEKLGTPGFKGEEYKAWGRQKVDLKDRVSGLESVAGQATGWTMSQTVALSAGAGALLPVFYLVVLPELIHWWLHKDDEDFHDQDGWEKQKYYHWYQMDDGQWLKSPRPIGYLSNLLGYGLGQALDEAYRDEPRTAENVLAVLQQDIPGVAEIPFGFGAHQNLVVSDSLLDLGIKTEAIPPSLEVPFSMATGRSVWQQRLVVPEWQGRVRPRQQAFRTTHQVYQDLARLIPGNAEENFFALANPGEMASRGANFLTGGRVGSEQRFSTTADTGKFLTSPLWLEQYGRFLGGSVLSETLRAKKLAGDESVPLSEIPVVRNFVQRAKDAPQMWPVRRVFELVEEGKALKDLKRTPGEGLTRSETAAYGALRERTEAGLPLSSEQEKAFRRLEKKSLTPGTSDILSTIQYNRLAERAQAMRELLSPYHDARRLGRTDVMERIDEEIIKLATEALADLDDERGSPGAGWGARWWRNLR